MEQPTYLMLLVQLVVSNISGSGDDSALCLSVCEEVTNMSNTAHAAHGELPLSF